MDKVLLTKALWDCAHKTFRDDAVRTKIYNNLFKTYDAALQEAAAIRGEDIAKVEHFTRHWIENSMGRAWTSIANSATTLTPQLFTPVMVRRKSCTTAGGACRFLNGFADLFLWANAFSNEYYPLCTQD